MERKKQRPGPKARYRGKVRDRPLTFALTPEGHAALAEITASRGLSRSDTLEELIRRARRRQPPKPA